MIFGKPYKIKKSDRIKVKNTTDQDHLILDQDYWVEEGSMTFVYDTKDARDLIEKKVLKEI